MGPNKSDEARLKAAMVTFDYYRSYWDPEASFKDYYTSRLEAHIQRCTMKYGDNPYQWPMNFRVEIGRCKLILEAIQEKEERDAASQIRAEEGPAQED